MHFKFIFLPSWGLQAVSSIQDFLSAVFTFSSFFWSIMHGEEDVRSCWMTLRTGEDTLIWRRKLWIALCGGIVLEEALDLSSDRLLNNNNNNIVCFAFLLKHPVLLSIHYGSCLLIVSSCTVCTRYTYYAYGLIDLQRRKMRNLF